MFPTCSPFPFVARKRLSRISRPRAKFVEGERRDSNPRPPGPQPGRSRRSRAASVLRSPEMDATKMRPRPFGEPVQAGASATTGAPSERAICTHVRRERARHCEARKADDGSRTRDLRLGNQRLDPPPQRGRHPPPVVVRYQARSPSPPGPQRGARSRLATAWSPCHPRRGCGCHRPVAATPLGRAGRCLLGWGSDRPDFPVQSG
jgi:hypothetical protein